MPRKIQYDDDMPRRRRSRGIDAEAERGLAMRLFLHSPKDVVVGGIACAAVIAIITNALFLQAGRHPAPMFGSVTALPAAASSLSHMPRARPAEADASSNESRSAADVREADPKPADPLGNLVRTTSSVPPNSINVPRPPGAVPTSHVDGAAAASRHVAAVQRALTEYGYSQLKPTGVLGPDTQAAIQKFERTRKLPVTGQVSDRLVRELAAVIGHPIE